MFYVISLRHVQIMTLSLTETLFRDSIFKVSLRGTKCRSNPVARDCFASLAITLIRTAMKNYINKIKVLQAGKYYYPFRGGMESSLYTLVNSLKDKVEFQILVSNTKPVTEIEFVEGVKVVRAASWGSLFSQPLSPGIFFWFRRIKADIIHLHLPNPLAGFFYLLANPGSRLIISYHSDILRQNIFRFIYLPFLKRLLNRAEVIVVTSQNLLNNSLLLGRLVYYKGLEYLIRAMRGIEAKLVIIGKGPLGPKLRRLACITGVKDKIVWLGAVSDEELKAYYLASDMLVLPSCQNSEAFGLVILEAQAFAKPVISTNLPTGISFIN